jgi:transcriptional regulator with GAF, ATPase, and Fis domain
MAKSYVRKKINAALINNEKLWRREMTNLKKMAFVVWLQTQLLESFSCLDVKRIIDLNEEKRRFEISLIKIALFQTNGSQRKAAKLLGTTPSLLNSKIKRYKIPVNQTLNKINASN